MPCVDFYLVFSFIIISSETLVTGFVKEEISRAVSDASCGIIALEVNLSVSPTRLDGIIRGMY